MQEVYYLMARQDMVFTVMSANLSQCYQKAGQLCGAAGYRVYDMQRNREFNSDGSSDVTHDLIISCNSRIVNTP